MQSFLCRVLALVFALNCILPTPSAWAQARRATPQKPTGATAKPNVGKKVAQAVNNQLPSKINAARANFENRNRTYFQRFQSLSELHELKNQEAKQQAAQEQRAKEQAAAAYQQAVRTGAIAERDATYVAPAVPVLPLQRPTNDVLDLLAKDELTLQNMGDFIDPLGQSNDSFLMNTVYASEALGNTVDYMLQAVKSGNMDKNALKEFNRDLEDVYLRLAYREGILSSLSHESMVRTMAVGSLRIAMLKVHNYLLATQKSDPLVTSQTLPGRGKPYTRTEYVEVMERKPGLDGQVFIVTKRVPKKVTDYVKQSASVFPPTHFKETQNKYFKEMADAAKKGLKPSDEKYQDVVALADYATKYTLLSDPASVGVLVKSFDKGAKDTDFKADNAAVINQILADIVDDNRQETRGSQKWNNAMQFFKNFSDPKVYSLSTRVIALEAASVLMNNQGKEVPFELRKVFARRAADLYEPLQSSYYKDYGLDSKQMQALANKLASIYNQFATEPLKIEEVTNNGSAAIPGINGLIDPGQKGLRIANNPNTSIPSIAPSNQGNMVQNPDGSIRMIYGYVYTSKGHWVEIAQDNALNKTKVDKENATTFFWFVGEAVLWVYGGAILETASQAFRFARGAMLALPRALNTAAKSNKGRKLLTFRVELTKAGRLASYTAKAVDNNVVLVARYIEKGAKPTVTVPARLGEGVAPVVKEEVIAQQGRSSMRLLQNEYSRWNPKRWIGMEPNRELVGLRFEQILPGGAVNSGTVNFTGRLASLKDGVKTYDQLRLLNQAMRGTEQTGWAYPWVKLTVPELRAARAYNRMWAMSQDGAASGAFDGYMNIKVPVYGSDKMPVLASQPGATGVTMESSWWNATKLGKPGNELFSTDVVVAPAMGRQAALTAFDPLSIPGAVKFPAEMLQNGQWAQQVGSQYFRIANYNNKFLDSFMPRLLPTKAFTTEFLTNPRFAWAMGKAWLKTSSFTQGVVGNLRFFGILAGLDYAANPLMRWYLDERGFKESSKEMADPKYGGAYDPAQLKEDEKTQEEIIAQFKAEGQDLNVASLDAYETVTGAEKESSEGMFMGAPIIFGREALGNLGVMENMYTPASLKNRLQYQAASVNFNRAAGKGNKVKNEKAIEKIVEAYRQQITTSKAIILESYKPYMSAAELKEMGSWYDTYLNEVEKILRSKASSSIQEKQLKDAEQRLLKRIDTRKEKVERQLELLGKHAADQGKASAREQLSREQAYFKICFAGFEELNDEASKVDAFYDSFEKRFLQAYDIKDQVKQKAAFEALNKEYVTKTDEWNQQLSAAAERYQQQVETEYANPFDTPADDNTLQDFNLQETPAE